MDTLSPSAPSITSGPSGPTSSTSASFGFSGEADATFECRLDSGTWESCTSPKSYSSLGQGSHTFEVRQSDQAGNTSAEASRTWTVDSQIPVAPVNTSAPLILGAAEIGQTLTAVPGAWTGHPTPGIRYQWMRCSGSRCSSISRATATSYTVVRADQGKGIRLDVSASNSAGTARASSALTPSVPRPTRPSRLSAPSISGDVRVGATLTGLPGTWAGSPAPSFSYQWMRCTRSQCSSISGATASSYILVSADQGKGIRLDVAATNSAGTARASSATTGPVAAASPSGGSLSLLGMKLTVP